MKESFKNTPNIAKRAAFGRMTADCEIREKSKDGIRREGNKRKACRLKKKKTTKTKTRLKRGKSATRIYKKPFPIVPVVAAGSILTALYIIRNGNRS